jgi:hypothetical protein
MVRSFVTAAVLCLMVGLVAGCGAGGPKLHPVKGRLTLKGKPCPGVTVTMTPDDLKGQAYMGGTDGEGNFEMRNIYSKPGVAVGEYQVSVAIPMDSPGGSMVPPGMSGKTSPWRITITDKPDQVLELDMSKAKIE